MDIEQILSHLEQIARIDTARLGMTAESSLNKMARALSAELDLIADNLKDYQHRQEVAVAQAKVREAIGRRPC